MTPEIFEASESEENLHTYVYIPTVSTDYGTMI
jgi:hypothetical protein